jgi:hypothetical protein
MWAMVRRVRRLESRQVRKERKGKMVKDISRRLKRLEARAWPDSFSFMIHFINRDNRVTSTLLMEAGKPQVWTHLEGEPEDAGRPPTPEALARVDRQASHAGRRRPHI